MPPPSHGIHEIKGTTGSPSLGSVDSVAGRGERGALLWEYDPPRAHPILYAGAIVFAVVLLTGRLEYLLRESRPFLYAVYALPLLLDLLLLVALIPSPVRLHAGGAAPARPLVLRWWRPFLPWAEVAAAYPASYDVTGAFVSPFASSDGK